MKRKILCYLNMFLIYSFIGFVLETFMKLFIFRNMNNGILYGPWIPIYGLSSIFIVFIMRLVFNKLKLNRVLKIVITLLISMIIITLIELLGGVIIEKLFHKVFWDYSKFKYNFGHYIAFEMTLLWGILSLIIIYVINPILNKFINKIPNIITYLVSVLLIIDIIMTTLSKFHIFHL